jgi:hypothetical protein
MSARATVWFGLLEMLPGEELESPAWRGEVLALVLPMLRRWPRWAEEPRVWVLLWLLECECWLAPSFWRRTAETCSSGMRFSFDGPATSCMCASSSSWDVRLLPDLSSSGVSTRTERRSSRT